jgi:hypothetical protein
MFIQKYEFTIIRMDIRVAAPRSDFSGVIINHVRSSHLKIGHAPYQAFFCGDAVDTAVKPFLVVNIARLRELFIEVTFYHFFKN